MIDIHSLFSKVTDLKTEKSKDNVIIQASDLLSGYINALFNNNPKIINDEETHRINIAFGNYNLEMSSKYRVVPLDFLSRNL